MCVPMTKSSHRTAIPEELLAGDIMSAMGRQVGISAEAVLQSNRTMGRKLERVSIIRSSKVSYD